MKIVPEPDRLDARVPLGILAVSILTLLLSAALALGVRSLGEHDLHRAANGARPLASPSAPSAQASGLFGRHTAPLATRQLPDRLREYGWVDRDHGLVHIPLERAKQLYLDHARAVPGAGVTESVSQADGGSR
jgi:hypothetical protein